MANKLRSTTNLVVPIDLQLPRADMKKRFMYVYSGAYPGLEPVFMNKLWLTHFFPEIAKDPAFGKDRKSVRKYAEYFEKYQKAGLLKLKKVNDPADPHFVVAVPLAEFNRFDVQSQVTRLKMWFTPENALDGSTDQTTDALSQVLKDTAQDTQIQQHQVLAKSLIPQLNLDALGRAALTECFFGLRLTYTGGLAVVYADFKISKAEAQQLTTTEWPMIRNMDLYPLLLHWQMSLWGFKGNAPVSSFPMSKISRTLPPVIEGQARVNEHGLSISPTGECLWLPEKLDNTARYEDLYAQVGDRGDDTFAMIDLFAAGAAAMSGEDLKIRLPANIPVLIDWVNNRYAYTQSNGVLKVQDLTRFKAANSAHAMNLLNHWGLDDKTLKSFVDMGQHAGVPPVLFFTQEEAAEIQAADPLTAARLLIGGHGVDVLTYWPLASSYFDNVVSNRPGTLRLADISTEGDPIWRPLARYVDTLQAAVIANMDAVNRHLSVSGTASRLGLLTLMSKYGNNLTMTQTASNTIRAAATKAAKGPDPDWTPPSVPLIMDNPERPFSLLPHQAKVRNLLQDSPDFAILPVQAGGGKTPLAIIDILMEIKANRSQPYLVLCPASLVSQYVKEVTYFTSGKVNCIPIVTEVIFRQGFERLSQMIANAPRNTVVIVNYDVLRNRAYDVCYGTTNVKVYPIIEFLRQFNFGYAMMDESHNLKNDSQRTRAALQLIADIPKKRLASGTMAHDSPSDLALQVATLDPTLFGSRDQFNAEFGAEVKGGRVMQWRPGAQQKIMARLKSRIVVAGAMRKEWAALLPRAIELMHTVDMTDAQQAVYTAILTEAFDKMKEDAKGNPALKKFFEDAGVLALEAPQKKGNQGENEEEDEEAEDAADESAGEALETLLNFYLARIEQFLTAPGKDELGARMLSGDDLRSPKVTKILQIIEDHLAQGIEGKVLVFTNYIDSAEEIYEAASPQLRAQGILYTAADKVEAGAAFESSPNLKWMVGVENSMNTGLNFQHVSRLIRVENVWNPGTLEQGNSRINRPEMKKADRRAAIYFDWIMANRTYDITKVSRLISKIIAVGKFENADNQAYEALPDVPVIPMSAKAILARNTREDLIEYANAYKAYNTVKAADYKEYREKHGDLMLTPLRIAERPNDAALMAEVPYVSGLTLHNGSELGLIRVDEYVRQNDSQIAETDDGGGGDDDSSTEDEALTPKQRLRQQLADALIGKEVHTEFGEGVVKGISLKRKRMNIALKSGYMARVSFAAAFVLAKDLFRLESARKQLLKGIAEDMPVVDYVTAISPSLKPDRMGARRAEKERLLKEKQQKERKITKKVESAINVELQFNVSNGFLGIAFYPEDNPDVGTALQAFGFRPVEPYVFAEIKTAQRLEAQFEAWHESGFRFEKRFAQTGAISAITDLAEVLKSGKLKTGITNYRFSSRNQLQNFFKMELLPSVNAKEFKPYPMIEDGTAYIVMHTRGQAGTKAAMRVKSPGIVWQQSPDCLVYYGLSLQNIASKLRDMQASGIQITNLEQLRKSFRLMRKQKFRNEEV